MAISIDPLTRVISVPQADLTQTGPSSYELDVNVLRIELKDLEDDPAGIYLADTHNHTAPVTLSGTTYARFVEIINGYTVEFEDGQYAVALKGANNNIVDVLVQNQVSVVANNSSGLIESDLIEYSSYQDRVTVDVVNGSGGTRFPAGTTQSPVDNMTDALLIAAERGFKRIFFRSDYTFDASDTVQGFLLEGESPSSETLTFVVGQNTAGARVANCTVEGTMVSPIAFDDVIFKNVMGNTVGVAGVMTLRNCIFDGTITLSPSLEGEIDIIDCVSGVPGSSRPVFDANGATIDVLVRNYAGGMEIRNFSDASNMMSIDMNSGHVVLDSTCTDGEIVVRGLANFTDNSLGATVNSTGLFQPSAAGGGGGGAVAVSLGATELDLMTPLVALEVLQPEVAVDIVTGVAMDLTKIVLDTEIVTSLDMDLRCE